MRVSIGRIANISAAATGSPHRVQAEATTVVDVEASVEAAGDVDATAGSP